MKGLLRVLVGSMLLFLVQGPTCALAEQKLDISELVLAVRKGIAEEQQRTEREGQTPMFLLKDFELEISFVVEKTGEGGLSLSVVTAGGSYRQGHVHTVRLRKETVAYDYVNDYMRECLEKPNGEYDFCLREAFNRKKIPHYWK